MEKSLKKYGTLRIWVWLIPLSIGADQVFIPRDVHWWDTYLESIGVPQVFDSGTGPPAKRLYLISEKLSKTGNKLDGSPPFSFRRPGNGGAERAKFFKTWSNTLCVSFPAKSTLSWKQNKFSKFQNKPQYRQNTNLRKWLKKTEVHYEQSYSSLWCQMILRSSNGYKPV